MGYLDHSTNNIIVDAVLTDTGRRLLSSNDGSFRISQFALSDEEVDYGIITKFGRVLGQEKIEKNTPVLEAPTRANLGQKYRLVSLSNPYLTHLPNIELTTPSSAPVELRKGSTTTNSTTLLFTVQPTNGTAVDDELIDEFFFVEVNNIFLDIPTADIDIINVDNTVVYRMGTETANDGTGKTILRVPLTTKGFSTSQFNLYKVATTTSSNDYVKVFVKITGATSGLTKSTEIRIRQSA